LYFPVNARSVPLRRRISYCSGLSSARHSASVFWIFVTDAVERMTGHPPRSFETFAREVLVPR